MTKLYLWLAVCAALGPAVGSAQSMAGDPVWVAKKCELYTQAWDALAKGQKAGLGNEFLARHQAFIASGCTVRTNVCPVSQAEIAVADTVSMMAIAEGMAGTFLPFACP